MILATRPKWLERPLGGLDKMYQLHKWTGIFAAKRKIIGNVSSITKLSSTITEVECNLGQKWPGHKPGQFALVNFN